MYRDPENGSKLAIAHADLLSALSNAKRLMILNLLMHGEVGVGELIGSVGLSQSALSQHLAILRSHKLVKTRREHQKIFYSAASEDVSAILNVLRGIFSAPSAPSEDRKRRDPEIAARRAYGASKPKANATMVRDMISNNGHGT